MGQSIAQIKVKSKTKLDQVLGSFTCFTRPDRDDEVIIDMDEINEVEGNFEILSEILEIEENSIDWALMASSEYIFLYP
jgi:hypothetical protein